MNDRALICPYCGGDVPGDTTICPDCHEDLAALIRLEYAHAIHYNEALAAAREGLLAEAEADLLTAVTLNPAFRPAHTLLASIYARQEDWDRAQTAIARALEIAPEDADILALGEAVREAAEQSEALRAEQQAAFVQQAIAREREELIAQARIVQARAATESPSGAGEIYIPATDEASRPTTPPTLPDEEIERFYEVYERQSTGAFLLGMGMATFAALVVSRLGGRRGS
jgi:tetratricopeptide (TPR) repeat protein